MKSQERHREVMTTILYQKSQIDNIRERISSVEQRTNAIGDLKKGVDRVASGVGEVHSATQSIQTTVVSMRTIGVQLLQLYNGATWLLQALTNSFSRLGGLPRQLRELLETIM